MTNKKKKIINDNEKKSKDRKILTHDLRYQSKKPKDTEKKYNTDE